MTAATTMPAPRRSRPVAAVLALALALLLASLLSLANASIARADDTGRFLYTDWHSTYVLGRDADGRANATVTERFTAQFPDYDQNHGPLRGIPTEYLNAYLNVEVLSVVDDRGRDLEYSTSSENSQLVVRIGDPDVYVHGLQTYVITYRMHDVVVHPDDADLDEFTWNLLPLNSEQPVERFSADIVVPAELVGSLGPQRACYEGYSGSTTPCRTPMTGPTDAGDVLPGAQAFHVENAKMPGGYGETVSISFAPGTFEQPPARKPNALFDVVPFATSAAAVLAALGSVASVLALRRRRPGRGVVVPQYEVPDTLPPIIAGQLVPRAKTPMAAQFVHFAVRGVMRFETPAETGGAGTDPDAARTAHGGKDKDKDKAERPSFRLLDPLKAVTPLERKLVRSLFGKRAFTVKPEQIKRFDVPKRDVGFGERMSAIEKEAAQQVIDEGLVVRRRSPLAVALAITALAIAVGGAVIGGIGFTRPVSFGASIVSVIAAFVVLFLVLLCFARYRVRTKEGEELRELLDGAREYITLAEADRLRMLQSYSGAERRADGSVDVIVLYERLLPYAILFGLEREWSEVLEFAYREREHGPDWYPGMTPGYLGASLASSSSSVSSAAAYTQTSSSSSSSGGGGFSGGGGGGGSSGGW